MRTDIPLYDEPLSDRKRGQYTVGNHTTPRPVPAKVAPPTKITLTPLHDSNWPAITQAPDPEWWGWIPRAFNDQVAIFQGRRRPSGYLADFVEGIVTPVSNSLNARLGLPVTGAPRVAKTLANPQGMPGGVGAYKAGPPSPAYQAGWDLTTDTLQGTKAFLLGLTGDKRGSLQALKKMPTHSAIAAVSRAARNSTPAAVANVPLGIVGSRIGLAATKNPLGGLLGGIALPVAVNYFGGEAIGKAYDSTLEKIYGPEGLAYLKQLEGSDRRNYRPYTVGGEVLSNLAVAKIAPGELLDAARFAKGLLRPGGITATRAAMAGTEGAFATSTANLLGLGVGGAIPAATEIQKQRQEGISDPWSVGLALAGGSLFNGSNALGQGLHAAVEVPFSAFSGEPSLLGRTTARFPVSQAKETLANLQQAATRFRAEGQAALDTFNPFRPQWMPATAGVGFAGAEGLPWGRFMPERPYRPEGMSAWDRQSAAPSLTDSLGLDAASPVPEPGTSGARGAQPTPNTPAPVSSPKKASRKAELVEALSSPKEIPKAAKSPNTPFDERMKIQRKIEVLFPHRDLGVSQQRNYDAGVTTAHVIARPVADREVSADVFFHSDGTAKPVMTLEWDGEAGGKPGEAMVPLVGVTGRPWAAYTPGGSVHSFFAKGNNRSVIASASHVVTRTLKKVVLAFHAEQLAGRVIDRVPVLVQRMERSSTSGNMGSQVVLGETVQKLIQEGRLTPQLLDTLIGEASLQAQNAKPQSVSDGHTVQTWEQWTQVAPDAGYRPRTSVLERLLSPDLSEGLLPSFRDFTNAMLEPRMVLAPNPHMTVAVVSIPHPTDASGKPLDLVELLRGLSGDALDKAITDIAHSMMAVAANDLRPGLDIKGHTFARDPQIDPYTSYTHHVPGSQFEGWLPFTHHMSLITDYQTRWRGTKSALGKAEDDPSIFRPSPMQWEWYDMQFGNGTYQRYRAKGGGTNGRGRRLGPGPTGNDPGNEGGGVDGVTGRDSRAPGTDSSGAPTGANSGVFGYGVESSEAASGTTDGGQGLGPVGAGGRGTGGSLPAPSGRPGRGTGRKPVVAGGRGTSVGASDGRPDAGSESTANPGGVPGHPSNGHLLSQERTVLVGRQVQRVRVTPEQARALDAARAQYAQEYEAATRLFSRPGEWAPSVIELLTRYEKQNRAILKK